MKLQLFQIDAFAEQRFQGNPAAVCPLQQWLDDGLLQSIAEENNLSETAFFVSKEDHFELRWFTPTEEVDLCGHATLATAFVLYEHLGYKAPNICFSTKSGELVVSKSADGYMMDFPALVPQQCEPPQILLSTLSIPPHDILLSSDYIVVYDKEQQVRDIQFDYRELAKIDCRGVVITAPGNEVDFVSRCFFPGLQVDEDPVTGSAHCELAPYWCQRLGKEILTARQLSKRGGAIVCEVKGDRIFLTGNAVHYMTAEIEV